MPTPVLGGYIIDPQKNKLLRAMCAPVHHFKTFSAPAEIDISTWYRFEDQSQMGSCEGQSLAGCGEFAWHVGNPDPVQFSAMAAYVWSQMEDGIQGRDTGATLYAGRNVAHNIGFCPEELWPYPVPVKYSSHEPAGARKAASAFKIQKSYDCRSYDDVFSFLSSGQGAVQIGINWPDEYMDVPGGIIEEYRGGSNGGHAVFFGGYNRNRYLQLVNSWGKQWGAGGFAYVSPRAVQQMLQSPDTVMIGHSDLTSPAPREVDFSGFIA
jgi:hypothetical protein